MYGFVFGIPQGFDEDYDKLFGDCIGENIADVMDECFYTNITVKKKDGTEEEVFPNGPILEGTSVSLKHLMVAIHNTFNIALRAHYNSTFSQMFRYWERINKYNDNHILTEEKNGTPCYIYCNVTSDFAEAIVWGAYFYAAILDHINKETGMAPVFAEEGIDFEITKNILGRQLLKVSGLTKEAFLETHFVPKLMRKYFSSTFKRILEDLKTSSKQNQNQRDEVEHKLAPDLLEEITAKQKQVIDNLTHQNEQLRARIAELEGRIKELYEAQNPTTILDGYKDQINAVFRPMYKVCGETFATYPKVQEVAQVCINVNDTGDLALLIEACIHVECMYATAKESPTKITKAFVGLRLLPEMDDAKLRKFSRNLGDKLKRELSDTEENLVKDISNRLQH